MYKVLVLLLLTGCGFQPSHKGDPQGCRERMALKVASIYTDPNNLHTALDTICGVDPTPTTTLEP